MTSSKNWTRIQTRTLTKTGPYFCRHSEQKNLQKLNNAVKLSFFKIVSMDVPRVFQFKFHLGFLYAKTWNALEKLTILWEWSIGLWVFVGDKFWGGAVGLYDKNSCLMGKLICAVVTQIFLNWIMYWDITLNVFKVNNIENDKIQVFLWKMRLWETISTRSSEK